MYQRESLTFTACKYNHVFYISLVSQVHRPLSYNSEPNSKVTSAIKTYVKYTMCLFVLFTRELRVDKLVTGKLITQYHLVIMLSHALKELKTAIQCLGIKPKAMIKNDSYIKDTELNGI